MATIQIILVVKPDWCYYSYGCVGTAYTNVHGSDNTVQIYYRPERYLGQRFDGEERERRFDFCFFAS